MTAGPSSASDAELLDAVRGLRWNARRSLAGGMAGAHRSGVRGSTSEFSEYRLYRQGDDPRRLDWRVLARSDRAYIRLSTDRSVLPTTLLVDASASMAFPLAGCGKWRLARELCVALAAIAHATGDPVGLTVARNPVSHTPPLSRSDVVSQIAMTLNSTTPSGTGDMAPFVVGVRTARLAIISDLLGDNDAMLGCARIHIARGREVHVVHVVAAEELHPGSAARVIRDPEHPSVERVLSEASVQQYEANFGAWLTAVGDNWRAAGAAYTVVSTDEPPAHAARRVVLPEQRFPRS